MSPLLRWNLLTVFMHLNASCPKKWALSCFYLYFLFNIIISVSGLYGRTCAVLNCSKSSCRHTFVEKTWMQNRQAFTSWGGLLSGHRWMGNIPTRIIIIIGYLLWSFIIIIIITIIYFFNLHERPLVFWHLMLIARQLNVQYLRLNPFHYIVTVSRMQWTLSHYNLPPQ